MTDRWRLWRSKAKTRKNRQCAIVQWHCCKKQKKDRKSPKNCMTWCTTDQPTFDQCPKLLSGTFCCLPASIEIRSPRDFETRVHEFTELPNRMFISLYYRSYQIKRCLRTTQSVVSIQNQYSPVTPATCDPIQCGLTTLISPSPCITLGPVLRDSHYL